MTILSPGTKYFRVTCSIHGIAYEDTDRDAAEEVEREHLDCDATIGWQTLFAGQESIPQPMQMAIGYPEGASVDMPIAIQREPLATDTFGFWGKFTSVSWSPTVPAMTIEHWMHDLGLMLLVRDGLQWAIGDALLYGETRFGEAWSQVASQYNRHTFENWRWVASRIPVSRRRENLAWSVHEIVAGLEEAEQEQWLYRAQEEQWTRSQLREAIKGALPEPASCVCPTCGKAHRKL